MNLQDTEAQRLALDVQLKDKRQHLADNGGLSMFYGLYEGDRRVKARMCETKFGECWLLHESEADLIKKRGSKFIPNGARSTIQKELGLSERPENAPAIAELVTETKLQVMRYGDRWGDKAELIKQANT